MTDESRLGHRISLSIIRDGVNNDSKRLLDQHLILDGMKHKEAVLGRLEIIAAMHKSCGCDSNPYSVRNKCETCSAVNRWASKSLSLKGGTLRFLEQDGEISLQARGCHVIVVSGGHSLNAHDNAWGPQFRLNQSTTIQLKPRHDSHQREPLRILVDVTRINADHRLAIPDSRDGGPSKVGFIEKIVAETRSCVLSETTGGQISLPPQLAEVPVESSQMITRHAKRPVSAISNNDVKVFLVPLGRELPSSRRKEIEKIAFRLDMKVAEKIRLATHVIISPDVQSLEDVAKAAMISELELHTMIEQNGLVCVLPRWITTSKGAKPHKPNMEDIWLGSFRNKKHATDRLKLQPVPRAHDFETNTKIAELFRTLSNLQQSCPLLDGDSWKSYSSRVVSGRIMHLDFEITNDRACFSRLLKVSGIGARTVAKIQEYFERGTFDRIVEFEKDPQRMAMKNIMGIWGVGEKTARTLVQIRGFYTIQDVRQAIQEGKISFDRNQLVGVDRYEDILEEMDREEVVMIADLIKEAVQRIIPGAEVEIMGSYRRGKNTCGDVDIHITHKKYQYEIPQNWCCLSSIVDLLWEQGHMMYHLTFLPEMKTGFTVKEYMKSSIHIPEVAWRSTKIVAGYMSNKGSRQSSYMGVFQSPKVKGRGRRVDIKIFPWRERVFATMYFTGNGFFNRSMRLWSARKYGYVSPYLLCPVTVTLRSHEVLCDDTILYSYTLNEHGLYNTGTNCRVLEADEESQIFEKLNLIYKEPHERDCFDAVIPRSEEQMDFELADHEKKVEANYKWVD